MCAEVYHCAGFIASDPVQFPHRYTLKQDIAVSYTHLTLPTILLV